MDGKKKKPEQNKIEISLPNVIKEWNKFENVV